MSQRLQILPYDPGWAFEFETERDRISRALGKLARRIDHNGSTAVPGLEAKPIIDIQVSVDNLNPIRAYAEPLAGLGYRHAPHSDDAVCPFFHRPSEWPHSHHVHVVESSGVEERRTLAFRDYLRDYSDVAHEYGVLKRRLAALYDAGKPADREMYASRRPSSLTESFRSLWHKDIRGNCKTPSNNSFHRSAGQRASQACP
ncbi:MAG TPA: GrpB family protein [Pyrinomonadaceae bacterium]|nr:GrpB family protein [Pyrinomonadaceae bacterium]